MLKLNIYYEDESGTQVLTEEIDNRGRALARFTAAASRGVYFGDDVLIPFNRIYRGELVNDGES